MSDLARLVDDRNVPLEEVVLAVTARFEGASDAARTLATFDTMAQGLALGGDPREDAQALAARLHDELGFDGERERYYDPRNSELRWVVSHRRGLPLTLSLIYTAVARRAGGFAEPIGFPGHVLVRHGGPEGVLQDPFHGGRILDDPDLADLAARFLGNASRLEAEHLLPLGRKALVVRVLANLRNAHAKQNDHTRCMLACDSLFAITGAPEARRDRGLHALALGAFGAAADDLNAYLEERPDAPDATAVRRALALCRPPIAN